VSFARKSEVVKVQRHKTGPRVKEQIYREMHGFH